MPVDFEAFFQELRERNKIEKQQRREKQADVNKIP